MLFKCHWKLKKQIIQVIRSRFLLLRGFFDTFCVSKRHCPSLMAGPLCVCSLINNNLTVDETLTKSFFVTVPLCMHYQSFFPTFIYLFVTWRSADVCVQTKKTGTKSSFMMVKKECIHTNYSAYYYHDDFYWAIIYYSSYTYDWCAVSRLFCSFYLAEEREKRALLPAISPNI